MNTIVNNTNYAIKLDSETNYTTIYNNLLIDNNKGGLSQGYDDGIENTWYNSTFKIGNYWSDWNGTGSYAIDGAANSVDFYPIEDFDDDGMPNYWEIEYGLNPLSNDANLDPDNDGLTNVQEYENNVDPYNNDTDNDTLTDGDEVNIYGTNPLDEDTDNDGLTDNEEVNIYGTNPLDEDTDGDNYTDGEEIRAGTDPKNPADNPDTTNSDTDTTLNTETTEEDATFRIIFVSVPLIALAFLTVIVLRSCWLKKN